MSLATLTRSGDGYCDPARFHAEGRKSVEIDGRDVTMDCTAFNVAEGWAELLRRDETGAIASAGGEVERYVIRGKVQVK